MDFYNLVKNRKSCRSFVSGKKVSWKEVVDLVGVANLIPLAGGIPVLQYILVTDSKVISELADACQQGFIVDSSCVLAVCSNKDQLSRNFDKKGELFAHQEAGAAINNILLAITEAGLSSCWIGHFSDRIVKRILKVPKNIDVEALLPIGYEAPLKLGDRHKTPLKPKVEDSLFFGEWDNNKRK